MGITNLGEQVFNSIERMRLRAFKMQSIGSRWLELIIVSNTILGLGWIVSREFSFWDGGVTLVAKNNELPSATISVWATIEGLELQLL